MQEFKLKHLLLKLFEITISYHSSGVNTLQCHFMYKNLKIFVSRCEPRGGGGGGYSDIFIHT